MKNYNSTQIKSKKENPDKNFFELYEQAAKIDD